ncbi:MAG: hypothetical protein H6600_04480 [Flavobacteriales bacterium]|nr:hypothetical protein [Flavobacteriales bacterium]MCB9197692.1 hypothetical protein [Flavobacteriales bacterium]
MNKYITTTFISLAVLFNSCGSGESETDTAYKISSEDVTGTIDGQPSNDINLWHGGGADGIDSEGKTLVFEGKGEVSIYLTHRSLQEIKDDELGSIMFDKSELVEEDDNSILIKIEKTDMDDNFISGYIFFVVMPYENDLNVALEGQGEEMFAPIGDEASARELLKIAKSFKKQ